MGATAATPSAAASFVAQHFAPSERAPPALERVCAQRGAHKTDPSRLALQEETSSTAGPETSRMDVEEGAGTEAGCDETLAQGPGAQAGGDGGPSAAEEAPRVPVEGKAAAGGAMEEVEPETIGDDAGPDNAVGDDAGPDSDNAGAGPSEPSSEPPAEGKAVGDSAMEEGEPADVGESSSGAATDDAVEKDADASDKKDAGADDKKDASADDKKDASAADEKDTNDEKSVTVKSATPRASPKRSPKRSPRKSPRKSPSKSKAEEEEDDEVGMSDSSSESEDDNLVQVEMTVPQWFTDAKILKKAKGLMRGDDDILVECKPMQINLTTDEESNRDRINNLVAEAFTKSKKDRDRFLCAHLDLFRPFLIEKALMRWYGRLLELTKDLTPEEALKITKEEAHANPDVNEANALDFKKTMPDLEPRAQWLRRQIEDEESKRETVVQPECIKNGTMRDYQLRGINWMASNLDKGISGILGDEMGLGKTLQTIAFLGYIKFVRKLEGPSVVVAPLSVLSSWMNEFDRWCPGLRVVRFHGPWIERQRIAREFCRPGAFDVVVTTYEMAIAAQDFFTSRYFWRYLVIDEAHRLKNEMSLLSQALMNVPRYGSLLLTGTPLQNNLHELWALLYFLQADLFTCSAPFDRSFDLLTGSVNRSKLKMAHRILEPTMLRRIKRDVVTSLPPKTETNVYVPLSPYQVFWYKRLLARDSGALLKVSDKVKKTSDSKSSGDGEFAIDANGKALSPRAGPDTSQLMSLFMQLRKVCNHPYLFPNSEISDDDLLPESEEGKSGEEHDMEVMQNHHVIKTSGKLRILDKLLVKLKQEGHRVLVFSLFTSMLDILEDYCRLRGWIYSRLDGSTNRVRRVIEVKRFNAKDSNVFLFLISTRAGGLGINLHTADTVIHYDSDFNPQVDLQAQDRAHRIGQTKPVSVYRLVTEGTVEERVVMRAQKKLYLDKMVTGLMDTKTANKSERMSTTEVLSMLMFGADRIFRAKDDSGDVDIDELLSRSRKLTKEAKKELHGADGGDDAGGDDEKKGSDKFESGKLSAKNYDFNKAVHSIREFQGVHYKRGSSSGAAATEWAKLRRQLGEENVPENPPDSDEDSFGGGKEDEDPNAPRKSRRVVLLERRRAREEAERLEREEEERRERRGRREARRAARRSSLGLRPSSGRRGRRSKRRRASRGRRRGGAKRRRRGGAVKKGEAVGRSVDWLRARVGLANPTVRGQTVEWVRGSRQITTCWIPTMEPVTAASEPPPPKRGRSAARAEADADAESLAALPVLKSRDAFDSWIGDQQKWWKDIHARRSRIARRDAVQRVSAAAALGLSPKLAKAAMFKAVTWKLDGVPVVEHDHLVNLSAGRGGFGGARGGQDSASEAAMSSSSSLDESGDSLSQSTSSSNAAESESDFVASVPELTASGRPRRSRRSTTRRPYWIASKATDERPASRNSAKSKTESERKRKWTHNEWCHLCKTGGDLVCCNWCPRAYHLGCVGRDEMPSGYWSCPQHQCRECGRKASDAGGLLFRCVVCPCAYCEDHVPSEHNSGRKDLAMGCPELEEIGYVQPASAYYVTCSHSCSKYYAAFKNDFKDYKEESRPDGKEHVMIKGVRTLVDKHKCACTEQYEEPQTLHCLCRTPYDEDKFYIGCDECRKWYHGECVGVKEGDIPEDEMWVCPVCKMKDRGRFTGGRRDEDLFEVSKKQLRRAEESDGSNWSDSMTPASDDEYIDAEEYVSLRVFFSLFFLWGRGRRMDVHPANVSCLYSRCLYSCAMRLHCRTRALWIFPNHHTSMEKTREKVLQSSPA